MITLIIGSSDIMKKILVFSSFLLMIIAMSTIGYTMVSANEQINEIKDKIVEQEEQESYLTPYGYTLDNPNIVLNPYHNSPLTALILFETSTPEEVVIEVQGKDLNSTYTNQFKESTKHIIPVYGLYPNTENIIKLTCGNKIKTYTIQTTSIPDDLVPLQVENNSNELYFISSEKYFYALDNNNEVRWYLTKEYSGPITKSSNHNFLLSLNSSNSNTQLTELVEIDLLGKIYKQYNIETSSQLLYTETPTSIVVLSENLIEIDKQTGTIINQIKLSDHYTSIYYNQLNNLIELTNLNQTLQINLNTKEQIIQPASSSTTKTTDLLMPFYMSNQNYKLIQGTKFNIHQKTEQSSENIFLINYKEIDQNYQQYNIQIQKTSDNLQITGEFKEHNEIYLILDKFLDKRIYDINENHTIINKEGLSGKYSIYLKIDDIIYKTNTYVTF